MEDVECASAVPWLTFMLCLRLIPQDNEKLARSASEPPIFVLLPPLSICLVFFNKKILDIQSYK